MVVGVMVADVDRASDEGELVYTRQSQTLLSQPQQQDA